MNFGERIRQHRSERQLTQPELAETLGIEQSYLSKLENGKSLPSGDVLNRILDVFGLTIGDLISDLDQGSRNQLRHIPEVAEYLRLRKQQVIGNQKRWLMLSALLLSVGVGLIYAGNAHLFFSDIVYQYKSHGIVLAGEPKEIFRRPYLAVSEAADHQLIMETRDAMNARIDEDYLRVSDFRGNVFNVPVSGGSRTYYLEKETEIDPWQSKLVIFIGVLMTILGLFGLFLDRKLSRQA